MTGPVLVTAFEPFGGDAENASALVLAAALPTLPATVVSAILPVSYHRAPAELRALVAQHHPRALLCLGQAAGRKGLSLEVLAQNCRDADAPDADGVRGEGSPVRVGAPATLVSTAPLNDLLAAARAVDAPLDLSTSAGGYVCNALFFEALLDHVAPRVGFLHVPLTTTQRAEAAGPRQDVARLAAGLAAVLRQL